MGGAADLEGVPAVVRMRPDDLDDARRYLNYVFGELYERDVDLRPEVRVNYKGVDQTAKADIAGLRERLARAGGAGNVQQEYARVVGKLLGQYGRIHALVEGGRPEVEEVAVRPDPKESFRDLASGLLQKVRRFEQRPEPVARTSSLSTRSLRQSSRAAAAQAERRSEPLPVQRGSAPRPGTRLTMSALD